MKRKLTLALSLVLFLSISLFSAPGFSHKANAAVSDWQKAASFQPKSSTDFGGSNFKQAVDQLSNAHANYVTLVIPLYQSSTTSTDVQAGWNTPTDDSLVSAISYVHSKGMHVNLNVHLETYSGDWRAYINPSDRDSWFKNYGNMVSHYAILGKNNAVEEMTIGTELISMASDTDNVTNTARWRSLISNTRMVFPGTLTYSANWGGDSWTDEKSKIAFWDALDYVGISAYFNLDNNTSDNSVSTLKNDWSKWNASDITPLEQKTNKPILFTEAGYKSVTGAHTRPWDFGLTGTYDPTEQSNAYEAMFSYWNDYDFMKGAHIWEWETDPNAGGAGSQTYTPQNKPAVDVISKWFDPANPITPNPTPGASVPAFQATGIVTPSAPSVGQTAHINLSVKDTGSPASAAIVDLEVYDSRNAKVAQKFFQNQNFASGQSLSYGLDFTSVSAETFTLKYGVFNSDWTKNYAWSNNVVTFTVSGQGSTPEPQPQPQPAQKFVIDVWWPTDGAGVSGTQPFKAMLEGLSTDKYVMYWQVEGGEMVPMYDSAQDYPHKEAQVNLSGWNWLGTGPYKISFIAKDLSGSTLGQKTINIYVTNPS